MVVFMVRFGPIRLFNGPERSGTFGFGRLQSCTVVLRSGTFRHGSFTVGYGPVTVWNGSVRKRYYMHAAAVYVLGLGIFWELGKNLTQV
jgi:hypothetical protein